MSLSWYERLVGGPGAVGKSLPRDIVVIDDHAEVRELVSLMLSRLGWVVHEAATGTEGWDMINAKQDIVGLAFVDVMLPDMDGMTLARQLRAKFPRLAIIVLSGRLGAESQWIVSDEGFRFLPKPFSLIQIRDVVADMLGEPDQNPPA